MQVSLAQLLQFEERYGNADRSALGASYPPSAVPAQKLGILEENSNGEKGYGGCDGRDPDGRLYICENEDEASGLCTQKNYEDGALCARWERGSCPPFAHMEWLASKGLKTHNSASATVGSPTPTRDYSSSAQCRSAPHLQLTRSVPTVGQCRTRTTASPATCC